MLVHTSGQSITQPRNADQQRCQMWAMYERLLDSSFLPLRQQDHVAFLPLKMYCSALSAACCTHWTRALVLRRTSDCCAHRVRYLSNRDMASTRNLHHASPPHATNCATCRQRSAACPPQRKVTAMRAPGSRAQGSACTQEYCRLLCIRAPELQAASCPQAVALSAIAT